MKIRVNPHNVEIVKEQTEPINEKEIKVSKCEFEFDEAITSEFVKEAYFTLNGNTYKMIVENNECDYPSEVLVEKGTLEIGVAAFKVENGEEIIRYNPSPDYFESWVGSLKDAENSEPITPSEMEQFEQELQNGLNDIEEAIENAERLNIEASKSGKTTTITITKQDGTTESEDILDGEDGTDGENGIGLQYDWLGTSLGVKREDEALFTYVNLEGKKGDPGAINLLIVNELPLVGSENTLYFVPKIDAEENDMYDECVWINNDWELVGTKQITIDLSDYYTKTQINNLLNGKIDDVQINESSIVSDNIANISVTGSYNETDSPLLSLWDVTIDGSIPIGADEDSIRINTTSGNYDGTSVLLATNDTLESEYVPIAADVAMQGTNYSSSINNVGYQIEFGLTNNTSGDSNRIVLTPTETYIGNVKDPENDGDAVNKKYVDDIVISGSPTDVQINGTSIVSNNVANILTEGVYGVRNKLLTKGYADARYVLEETIDDNVGYMYISPNIKDDKDVDFSINVQSNLDSEAFADMNFGVEYDENEDKGHGYFRLRLYDAGSIEIDNTGTKITNVITPTNDTDAVNKLYVDSLVGNIGTILDNINGEVIGG